MCGIFGYVNKSHKLDTDAAQIIYNGLKRLEYRGYDSSGVAVATNDKIHKCKQVGSLNGNDFISHLPKSNVGIGHNRWATHGKVSITNAHPHFSSDKSFILAQNGIVENFQGLKKMLLDEGFEFKTETDTEVIVRLIEFHLQKKPKNDLQKAIKSAFLELEGRNTIIVLKSDGGLIAVRNGSPLVIGINDDEYFVASDTLSFADRASGAIVLENHEMVAAEENSIEIFNIKTDQIVKKKPKKLSVLNTAVDKEGFDYFMLKEIFEQSQTLLPIVNLTQLDLQPLVTQINKSRNIYTVGAGTASFVAGQIAYYLRSIGSVNAIELKSYESHSHKNIFSEQDLIIAVSQSGETADTLEVLEWAREKGMKIASIVNMEGSTISRMSDYEFYTQCGPEICVASTKVVTTMMGWGYFVAKSVAGEYEDGKENILTTSNKLRKYLTMERLTEIDKLADKIITQEHFFVLGRGMNFYSSLEAGLKVKEISYKHFEAFSGGELKHGVIALVEENTPVFCIVSNDNEKYNILNAAAEVKARGAHVIGVCKEPNNLFDDHIITPDCEELDPLVNLIPFQLLSYSLARKLKLDPDKPRNLAKSVTVK